jgi:hypothetical protein
VSAVSATSEPTIKIPAIEAAIQPLRPMRPAILPAGI